MRKFFDKKFVRNGVEGVEKILGPLSDPKKNLPPIQEDVSPLSIHAIDGSSMDIKLNLHVNSPGVTCPSNTSFPPYQRTRAIAPCDNTPIIPSNPPKNYNNFVC